MLTFLEIGPMDQKKNWFIYTREKVADISDIQSVMINRHQHTEAEAREWLTKHGFKSDGMDTTKNWMRFRQHDPAEYKRLRIKTIHSGLKFVIGWKTDG